MRRRLPAGAMRNTQELRVRAPRDVVWRQLGLAPSFFETLPVDDVEIAPGGKHAGYVARIGIGPIALKRRGHMQLESSEAPRRLEIRGGLEDGSLSLTGELTLSDMDAAETLLRYDLCVELPYEMPRLQRFVSGILDEHVREYLRRVAGTATRHHAAELAMGSSTES